MAGPARSLPSHVRSGRGSSSSTKSRINPLTVLLIVLALITAIGLLLVFTEDKSTRGIDPKVLAEKALAEAKARAEAAKGKNVGVGSGMGETEGWSKEILKAGDGLTYPKKGQTVSVHYVGTLTDGSVFDSTTRSGKPFDTEIGVGKVIRGWDEGVVSMSLGEKSKFTIQPDYGYGERGYVPLIPSNAVLIFEIELLKIYGQPP
ncbi:hypothetical protein HDU76_004696 [Blyttiomyces sp. JEL0837]|nr:hypothetical protein HDU76_004696 [Blyttiomyces sp. JEL0837]